MVSSKEGRVRVEGLEFPEDFPAGKYTLVIRNASERGIGDFAQLEIEMVIQAEVVNKQPNKKK